MYFGGVLGWLTRLAVLSAIFLYGCDSPSDSSTWEQDSGGSAGQSNSGISDIDRIDRTLPAATVVDARPAALINGGQVNWGELRPLLNEAAGGNVLEEIILDRILERQVIDSGIIITDADLTRERELLLRTLSSDPNVARRLLDQLRSRRGLGDLRFQRLLTRNARLRAIVGDRVEINESQITRMYDILHGPKRQARLMVVPDLSMAQEAIRRVQSGRNFADVAVELSIDSSASRGGLLEPISQSDPAYPSSIRTVLWSLGVGEISTPVLMNDQYAVLQLVRTLSASDISVESTRVELEYAVRLDQQRLLMDQLVERIMNDVSVVIFDDSLREAWKRRAGVE